MKRITQHFQSDTLKSKALKSTSITFIAYGLEQSLRLLSNLILTRILYPEAFGMMALATAFLVGLSMLSDIGIHQAIIQNQRSHEKSFRNTAWVAQIFRGLLLWLLACLIAYPASIVYENEQLFPILCALGLTLFINGFGTTAIAINSKQLKLFKLFTVNLCTQILTLISTVLFAFYTESVWALVWGNILGNLIGLIGGHQFMNDGFQHRFKIHWSYMKDIFSFGKWIFISSIFGFLANQADRIIIGKMLSLTELGIFTIAVTFSQVPRSILFALNEKVLFPIYASVQHHEASDIHRKVFRSKLLILGSLLPISLFLMLFGESLISWLYDDRYSNASWMLQILAVGSALEIATNSGLSSYLLGLGKPTKFALFIGIKAFTLIALMILGIYFGGASGLLLGIAISPLIYYIFEISMLIKLNIWFWKLDLSILLLVFIIASQTLNNHIRI